MGNRPVKVLSASESNNISRSVCEVRNTEKRKISIDKNVNRCFNRCMKEIDKSRNKGITSTQVILKIKENIYQEVLMKVMSEIEQLSYNIAVNPYYNYNGEFLVDISW